MGDSFRPRDRDRRSQYDRSDRYDSYYDRSSYYDQPPRRSAFDRYECPRSPRRDWGERDRRVEQNNNGYVFHGAAARDSYRNERPQDTFSFRATGHSAPRFPSPDRRPPPPRHAPADRRGPHGRQNDRTQGYRGRGGFRRSKPHTRDILNKVHRGGTPEQLEGMNNNGQAHFAEVIDSSSDSESDDEEIVDLAQDSEEEEDGGRSRAKRVKLEVSAHEPVAPRWSNPDPYTALPPPESLGAPKKDIVQVIRKAKLDSARQGESANAVKANQDFISFFSDAGSEEGEASDVSDSLQTRLPPPSDAPSMPASMRMLPRLHDNPTSNGFNFTSFHSRSVSSPLAPDSEMDYTDDLPPPPPPPPPVGVDIPSKEEIANVARQVQGPSSKKRKFNERSKGVGDIVDEWQPNGSNPAPWCIKDWSDVNDMGLRLHHEICEFMEFVQPHDYEEAVRQQLIARIQDAVRRWSGPGAKDARSVDIRCFGSFAAGLYLPTADMDLVAVSQAFLQTGYKTFCQTPKGMRKLALYFDKTGVAAPGSVSPVLHAKVPLVKFTDRVSGIQVDVSFENDSGLIANQTFQDWKLQYPAMPTLVVIIKQLLAMRGLNEVFSGGLGGFSIICLVVNMLHRMGPVHPDNIHYGDLLLRFLDLYGNQFNLITTGLDMDPPGHFDKISYPMHKQNHNGLTIRDPNRPNNDISGGSRNVGLIFDLFRTTHVAIRDRLAQIQRGVDPAGSVLECVLGGNYTSFLHQRNKLSMLHRGRPVSPPLVKNPKSIFGAANPQSRKKAKLPAKPPATIGATPTAPRPAQEMAPGNTVTVLPPKPPAPFGGHPTAPLQPQYTAPKPTPAFAGSQEAVPPQPQQASAAPWGSLATPTYPLQPVPQHQQAVPQSSDIAFQPQQTHAHPQQAPLALPKKARNPPKAAQQLQAERAERRAKRNKAKEDEAAREAIEGPIAPKPSNPNPKPNKIQKSQTGNAIKAKQRAAQFKKDFPHMKNVPNALGKKAQKKLKQEAMKQQA